LLRHVEKDVNADARDTNANQCRVNVVGLHAQYDVLTLKPNKVATTLFFLVFDNVFDKKSE
jgi:hypothetical protein